MKKKVVALLCSTMMAMTVIGCGDNKDTKEDVAELLKITEVQAYLQIKKLLAEGKLVPNQKGKYANYKLKN